VFGPHSIASLTTEWRAYLFTIWCGVHRRTDLDIEALGFTADMAGKEQDPVMEKENPELTDGAYIGPSRGHLFPRWARYIGMPRAYGYGASMGAWILDYLSGWAGSGHGRSFQLRLSRSGIHGRYHDFQLNRHRQVSRRERPIHRGRGFQDDHATGHDHGHSEG